MPWRQEPLLVIACDVAPTTVDDDTAWVTSLCATYCLEFIVTKRISGKEDGGVRRTRFIFLKHTFIYHIYRIHIITQPSTLYDYLYRNLLTYTTYLRYIFSDTGVLCVNIVLHFHKHFLWISEDMYKYRAQVNCNTVVSIFHNIINASHFTCDSRIIFEKLSITPLKPHGCSSLTYFLCSILIHQFRSINRLMEWVYPQGYIQWQDYIYFK